MIDKINKEFHTTKSTIYDTSSLTILESIGKFLMKVNEVVEEFNNLDVKYTTLENYVNEKIGYLLGEGLNTEVLSYINKLCGNGTITNLINNQILQKLNEKFDNAIANLNEGETGITNSEIVDARHGEKTLSNNIGKIKDNLNKSLKEIFTEELRYANSSDFIGSGTPSITSDRVLSVYSPSQTMDYVYTNSDIMEFNIKNSSYVVLGYGNGGFTVINLTKINNSGCGKIGKIKNNQYTTVTTSLFEEEFLTTDTAKIEIITNGYNLYKNNKLILTIKKSDIDNDMWSTSKLGFMVKPDNYTDLVSNIKINDYSNKSQIKDNKDKIIILENKTNILDDNVKYKSYNYEEMKTEIEKIINNYNGTLSFNNNILNSSKPSAKYNACYINTKRIKFTIKNTNYVVLGISDNKFTTVCLKSENESYVGAISDFESNSVKIKANINFSQCKEGDEIIVEYENNNYIFQINGKAWFTIKKSDYSDVYNWSNVQLGFLITPTEYENLVENLYHDEPIETYILIKDKVTEINNKINSLNPSKFSNKKGTFLGDSITYGYGLSNRKKAWCYVLGQLLGLKEIVNLGISGSTIANGQNSMAERYKDIPADSDFIFVFGITNDYGMYPTEIGNEEDNTITTVYGALNVLMNGLLNKYPNSRIYFLTPVRRMFSKEQPNLPDTTKNSLGYSLNDYRRAIINRCEYYSIKYIDTYVKSGLNPNIASNKTLNYIDIAHLTENGHMNLALSVQEEI